jgi:polysaccharide biosynthesis protein PslG
MRHSWIWLLALVLLVGLLAGVAAATRHTWSRLLFDVTGEDSLGGQVRGGLEWLGNLTRPQPNTAASVPVANAGVNPFGINTFLEQEVEPEKRERSVQMIADAGFHWIRQEFPWEDIEIHGKGDFEDRRHEPYRSAWDKYDQIVDLAGSYGLEIIARLSNPPEWSRAKGAEAGTFAPPDNLNDYGDFVEAVVSRYRDRIRYYQVWNEPNIYPEWGEQPVSPEAYTELLKVAYTRIKVACPECVVISGALAQTIPLGPRDLNDFIFLQRMYDAGAGSYFDVLAMQDYGLWSGPTDRRMRPRVLNFSRPLYLREIMVKNGDAAKPIWITEMNWNAPPVDLPDKRFGFVTPEQQARNAVLAYQRIKHEWPWVGVVNFWFFKRATDQEKDQSFYYFRMVEPDFTPLPVYDALKAYTHSDEAHTLYPGVHQENHWLLTYTGEWQTRTAAPAAPGGIADYRITVDPQAGLSFAFEGRQLWLQVGPEAAGTLHYSVDGTAEGSVSFAPGEQIRLAGGLSGTRHTITIRPADGPLSIDSLTIGK